MLRNYLKVALRSLRRQRGFAFITIGGLAVSLAVCLLVLLFVRQQWQMDRFHPGADRIHRITTVTEAQHYAISPRPLAAALRDGYADAKAAVRLAGGYLLVRSGGENVKLNGLYAEPSFFEVFGGFQLARGDARTALSEPRAAVLTPEAARRFFGEENPIGQTLARPEAGRAPLTVTGVLAETDGPSHLSFEALFSYASAGASGADAHEAPDAWTDIHNWWTYVRLREGAGPAALEAHAAQLFAERVPPEEAKEYALRAESLGDIRFGPTHWNEISGKANVPDWMFYLLGLLAMVIALAAGFNYVNLSVARSLRRAQEIGVRRAVGAQRGQVAAQFLCEAVLVALLATVLASVLLRGLAPLFSRLYLFTLLEMEPVAFRPLQEPGLLLLILGFGAAVGLLAGAYPAFVLSGLKPLRALKAQGQRAPGRGALGSLSLRKALLVAQFAFTLLLAVLGATAFRQAAFVADTDYALRTERLLSVNLHDVPFETFRQRAVRLPGVEGVSATSDLPLGPSDFDHYPLRSTATDAPVRAYYYAADSSFTARMDLALRVEQPGWQAPFARGEGVLLNEAAAQKLGFRDPQSALGEAVTLGAPDDPYGTFAVLGVVEDYRFGGVGEMFSFEGPQPVPPMVLHGASGRLEYALVRATPGQERALLAGLERDWTHFDTALPFDAQPYREVMRFMFGPLQDLAWLVGAMAGLAVLIACLGLLGLAAYAAQTRVKEIGIRKVLGASAWDVVRHLSKSFAALVALGVALAAPLAYLLSDGLLQLFPYRPDGSVLGLLAACSVGVLLLALAVVASQTLRAARANPTESLRAE